MIYSITTLQQRLEVLQLARQLGNVSHACKRMGIDRTSFYRWQRRFHAEGESGLANRSRAHRNHPRATSPEMERRVLEYVIGHPQLSCTKLSVCLHDQGCSISAGTIHSIFKKHRMTRQSQRWDLAELAWHQKPDLKIFGPDFIAATMKRNPRQCPGYLPNLSHLFDWQVHIAQFIPNRRATPLYLLLAIEVKTGLSYVRILENQIFDYDLQILVERILKESQKLDPQKHIIVNTYALLNQFNECIKNIQPGLIKRGILTVRFQLNPGLESPWVKCILKWMQASSLILHRCKQFDLETIQKELSKWFTEYNSNFKIPGYPHFGRSPNAISRGYISDDIYPLQITCDKLLSFLVDEVKPISDEVPVPSNKMPISKSDSIELNANIYKQPAPLTMPFFNNSIRSSTFVENMNNRPYYANTSENVFATIYGRSPYVAHDYRCGDCVRLTVSNQLLKYGFCPIHKDTTWFTNEACEHFQPRGYSIR